MRLVFLDSPPLQCVFIKKNAMVRLKGWFSSRNHWDLLWSSDTGSWLPLQRKPHESARSPVSPDHLLRKLAELKNVVDRLLLGERMEPCWCWKSKNDKTGTIKPTFKTLINTGPLNFSGAAHDLGTGHSDKFGCALLGKATLVNDLLTPFVLIKSKGMIMYRCRCKMASTYVYSYGYLWIHMYTYTYIYIHIYHLYISYIYNIKTEDMCT